MRVRRSVRGGMALNVVASLAAALIFAGVVAWVILR